MRTLPFLHSILAATGLVSVSSAAPAFVGEIRPLLEAHCLDCHGSDVQKGGLRLDGSPDEATWIKVHDKLAAGEMPPDSEERPPQAMLDSSIRALHDSLHATSLEAQRREGRVPIRRLNGTEYENTVRALVGTNVRLKDLLPEDNSVGGFDNVSAALDLSSTHFLRYQDAAEAAVMSALPRHPPLPVKERRSGREMSEKGSNFRQTLTRSCYLKGDSLVVHSKLPRYGLVCTPSVPGRGRYRIRMSAAAVGAANEPVAVAFATVDGGREPPVVRDMVDLQPGPPQIVETEIDLEAREAFVVNLMLNWDVRATKEPIEAYDGPGFLIEWLEIEGPIGEFPPESYTTLFGDAELVAKSVLKARNAGSKPAPISPTRNADGWRVDPLVPVSESPREDAEALIRAFLPSAFRREVEEELKSHYVGLVHAKLEAGDTFLDAMTYGYKAILTSPYFLFFRESPGEGGLDSTALANRLAYFLTSLPPDEALLAADLVNPEELRRQTERLLDSPASSGFIRNFTGQWLELRKIDATIPDPNLYPDFDGTLLWSMPMETERYFAEILKHDRSVLEFVDSDWSMLNARLADHYGIPGVVGNGFRRVALPEDSHRGGVLTHGSVLKVTADGTTTSPVLRGKWVLEQIIGKPPSPPPPDIATIEPDIRGAATIREQLDKHRSSASCNRCHRHIDPPGFALESFDPIGGYREFYRASSRTPGGVVPIPGYSGRAVFRGPEVEKGGITAEGKAFATVADYRRLLLDHPDQIARNLAEKLLTYATGAEPQFADREVIEEIVDKARTKNYGLRTMVHEIVQSRPFRNK